MSLLQNMLKHIDFVGSQVSIKHNNSREVKTTLGGILTIFITIFSIYSIVYFSQDIFTKNKPISRMSKNFINQSIVEAQDFPFVMYLTDTYGNTIQNLEKYVIFEVFHYAMDGVVINSTSLTIEQCEPKHMGKYQDIFYDPGNAVPMSQGYCLNPKKINNRDGTYTETNYNFTLKNEWNSPVSNTIIAGVQLCNTNCASEEEYKSLGLIYVAIYYLDYYIDLNDFTNPIKPYIQTYTQVVSRDLRKAAFVRLKQAEVETDAGFLLEDPKKEQFRQVNDIRLDLQGEKIFMVIY
jgi:hypothetical protein